MRRSFASFLWPRLWKEKKSAENNKRDTEYPHKPHHSGFDKTAKQCFFIKLAVSYLRKKTAPTFGGSVFLPPDFSGQPTFKGCN